MPTTDEPPTRARRDPCGGADLQQTTQIGVQKEGSATALRRRMRCGASHSRLGSKQPPRRRRPALRHTQALR
jgi:hypothetical protein